MSARFHVSSKNHRQTNSLLVIEEDRIQRKGLAVAFMDAFSEIEMAGELVEGIKIAANKTFDLIIVDLDSRNTEAFEELKTLMKLNPNTKLIVIAGELNDEMKEQLNKLSTHKIFDKPYSIKALLAVIENLKSSFKDGNNIQNSIE